MSAAIASAMTDSYRSLSNVTGSCDTNHCEWEPYTTLAICSTVEDVSSLITKVEPVELGDPRLHLSQGDFVKPTTFWSQSVGDFSGLTGTNNDLRWYSIAEIYLIYSSPCENTSIFHNVSQNWRAYKATFSLCLQTLNSSYINSILRTEILREEKEIAWEDRYSQENVYAHPLCGNLDREDEDYCTDMLYLQSANKQLTSTFTTTAVLDVDNAYSTAWGPTLVADVLGSNPQNCTLNETTLGFNGFTRRIKNVAISMSNA
jgi:hypothetical protein